MAVSSLRQMYQVKVTLVGSKPPIWRRLLVPSTMRLSDFHGVLQIAMGWTDSHLHEFVAKGERYGASDAGTDYGPGEESRVKVGQVLEKEKDVMDYEYDFGDGWRHKIVLEKILPFDKKTVLPKCVAGKRACPPEDCGGIWGYERLLKVMRDPSDPEYEETLEWLGEDLDPEAFDMAEVNAVLQECFG